MKNADLPTSSPNARSHQRGFTLIEVLIALIVLVLGVLGAAAMTLNALRDNKQSALRSQATAYAYELGDMIRMNNGGSASTASFLAQTATQAPGCYGAGCALDALAANDYAEWYAKVTNPRTGLPGATVKVCRDTANPNLMNTCDNAATSPIVVKMQWTEKNSNGQTGSLTTNATPANQPSLVVVVGPY